MCAKIVSPLASWPWCVDSCPQHTPAPSSLAGLSLRTRIDTQARRPGVVGLLLSVLCWRGCHDLVLHVPAQACLPASGRVCSCVDGEWGVGCGVWLSGWWSMACRSPACVLLRRRVCCCGACGWRQVSATTEVEGKTMMLGHVLLLDCRSVGGRLHAPLRAAHTHMETSFVLASPAFVGTACVACIC